MFFCGLFKPPIILNHTSVNKINPFCCFGFRAKEKPQIRRKKMISLRRSTGDVRSPAALPCTLFVSPAQQKGNAAEIKPFNEIFYWLSETAAPLSAQVCKKRVHVPLVSSVVWWTFLQRVFRSLLQKVTENACAAWRRAEGGVDMVFIFSVQPQGRLRDVRCVEKGVDE